VNTNNTLCGVHELSHGFKIKHTTMGSARKVLNVKNLQKCGLKYNFKKYNVINISYKGIESLEQNQIIKPQYL